MDYQAPPAGAGGRGCYNCESLAILATSTSSLQALVWQKGSGLSSEEFMQNMTFSIRLF